MCSAGGGSLALIELPASGRPGREEGEALFHDVSRLYRKSVRPTEAAAKRYLELFWLLRTDRNWLRHANAKALLFRSATTPSQRPPRRTPPRLGTPAVNTIQC